MNKSLKWLVFSLSMIVSLQAHAEEIFYDYEEEIVVTGTRTKKIMADAPIKTEVISEGQIEE
ncbi:MAG: hypothetical protein HRT44_09860 [Bdellovibrionales bacterium]|nr:hypothetical protein [Bdellovibrionales bacterium]NQZ19544.1 hypothetical protein [Bdellovibrionales bacterium]